LTDAHLVAYSELSDINIDGVFENCEISGVQDPANDITLCKPCHVLFDQHFVAVNPETSRLEVSNALLHSSE
jgi:predicted restriction endonuclease